MKISLKRFALSSLALLLAQSSFALQPGIYYPVNSSIEHQCSVVKPSFARTAKASRALEEPVLVLRDGQLTLLVDNRQRALNFSMTNNQGTLDYSFTDHHGTVTGNMTAQLGTENYIILTGNSNFRDNRTGVVYQCTVSGRFDRRA